ncbi:hypothetical protein M9Y10_030144 [Tritrichomonas musculus]|uniref:Uncharacterized protein n=1 Tax=Tritrichomonas musculus TaxID=1915356 RepID=A0ABR2KPZ1_9EUKA
MIFFLINFTLSRQFNVTSNSIKSLVLYFHPHHCIEVSVSSEFHTYFSDLTKANGISLEIQTNNSSTFGPFNHRSHLDGIDFHPDNLGYKLIFTNEGNNEIQLATVFARTLKDSLKTINEDFSNFEFPISNYPSSKFSYFNSEGLIFHEKKYSSIVFFAFPISIFVICIVICIIGIPNVFYSCYSRKQQVSNDSD